MKKIFALTISIMLCLSVPLTSFAEYLSEPSSQRLLMASAVHSGNPSETTEELIVGEDEHITVEYEPTPRADQSAVASFSAETLGQALQQAKADGQGRKNIRLLVPSGDAKRLQIEVPAGLLTQRNADAQLIVDTPLASFVWPNDLLASHTYDLDDTLLLTLERAGSEKLPQNHRSEVGNRPVIHFELQVNGLSTSWNPFSVALRYTPGEQEKQALEKISVWQATSNNVKPVPSGTYNSNTGKVHFQATDSGTYAVAYVDKTYDDMNRAEWAREIVEVLSAKGIVTGTDASNFSPSNPIKRADYVVLLMRTLGAVIPFDSQFADVAPGTYYYDHVGAAKQLGIIIGGGDNRFHPQSLIKREDMMVIMDRVFTLAGLMDSQEPMSNAVTILSSTSADEQVLSAFEDAGLISSYARSSVANLVRNGIIQGNGGRINPQGDLTRAEAAAAVFRFYMSSVDKRDSEIERVFEVFGMSADSENGSQSPGPQTPAGPGSDAGQPPQPGGGGQPGPSPSPGGGGQPGPSPTPGDGEQPGPSPTPGDGEQPGPSPTPPGEEKIEHVIVKAGIESARALFLNGSPAAHQGYSENHFAFDGDIHTGVQASGQYAWQLEVELEKVEVLDRIKILMGPNNYATKFQIRTAGEDRLFTTHGEVDGFDGGDRAYIYDLRRTEAKFIRIVGLLPDGARQRGDQMRIMEVEVYAHETITHDSTWEPPYVDESLLLSVNFDEQAHDGSKARNHGEAFGKIYYQEGLSQQALNPLDGYVKFDGTRVPGNQEENFSVSFWMKSQLNKDDSILVARGADDAGWEIGVSNDGYLTWRYNTLQLPNIPELQVADGKWHHIVVVHDRNSTAKFYMDGNLEHEIDLASAGQLDESFDIVIGNDSELGYPSNEYSVIDELNIYGKVLSAGDVGQLYDLYKDIALIPDMVRLIGAEHTLAGSTFELNFMINAPSVAALDRVKVEVEYDPNVLELVGAQHSTSIDRTTPGKVVLTMNRAARAYNLTNMNEAEISKYSTFSFSAIGAGESEVKIGNVELYNGATLLDKELEYTKQAYVKVHAKAQEDINQDGLVTLGDLVLAGGASEDMLRQIAESSVFAPYKRVVVIGMDGMGIGVTPEAPFWASANSQKVPVGNRLNIPAIRSLIDNGTVTYTAEAIFPTISGPNWLAMLNGSDAESMIFTNEYAVRNYYKEDSDYPTVFKRIREATPERRLASYVGFRAINVGLFEQSAGVETLFNSNDHNIVNEATSYIASEKMKDTALMFIHLGEVDHVGHRSGYYQQGWYDSINEMDHNVHRIVEAIDTNGLREDTLILMVTDHGGATETENGTLVLTTSHGQDSPLSKTVFYAANGRTVGIAGGGDDLLTGGSTKDMATNVLHALGIAPSTVGDGQTLDGMFGDQRQQQVDGAPLLGIRPIVNRSTGMIEEYQVELAGSSDTRAVELHLEMTGFDVQAIEAVQAGSGIVLNREENGKTRIILVSDNDLPEEQSVIRIQTSPHPASAAASIHHAMTADGSGKETMPNLTDRLEPGGDLDSRLVLALGFDGNALDSSSRENHGTEHGNISYVAGIVGSAAHIQGGHIRLDSSKLALGDSQDFTVSFLLKSGRTTGDPVIISNKDWNSGSNPGWVVALEGDILIWNFKGADAGRLDLKPLKRVAVADNQWHHIVITHDRNGVASFYVDGVLEAEIAIAGAGSIDTMLDLVIGNDGTTRYSHPLNAVLDELRIYNAALTEREVSQLYQQYFPEN